METGHCRRSIRATPFLNSDQSWRESKYKRFKFIKPSCNKERRRIPSQNWYIDLVDSKWCYDFFVFSRALDPFSLSFPIMLILGEIQWSSEFTFTWIKLVRELFEILWRSYWKRHCNEGTWGGVLYGDKLRLCFLGCFRMGMCFNRCFPFAYKNWNFLLYFK